MFKCLINGVNFSNFLNFRIFSHNLISLIIICMLHIVLQHYSKNLYSLASCKSLIFVYKPSSALGKTLFILILFISTINCLSCTINCFHSFIHSFIHSFNLDQSSESLPQCLFECSILSVNFVAVLQILWIAHF